MNTPEEGARTAIHLATSPDVAGMSGRYFIDGVPDDSPEASYDQDLQNALWQASQDLTGLPSKTPAVPAHEGNKPPARLSDADAVEPETRIRRSRPAVGSSERRDQIRIPNYVNAPQAVGRCHAGHVQVAFDR